MIPFQLHISSIYFFLFLLYQSPKLTLSSLSTMVPQYKAASFQFLTEILSHFIHQICHFVYTLLFSHISTILFFHALHLVLPSKDWAIYSSQNPTSQKSIRNISSHGTGFRIISDNLSCVTRETSLVLNRFRKKILNSIGLLNSRYCTILEI